MHRAPLRRCVMKIRNCVICGFLLTALCLSSCGCRSFLQSRELKQEETDSGEQAKDTDRGDKRGENAKAGEDGGAGHSPGEDLKSGENSRANQAERGRADPGRIWVQIQGAVERPGVYALPGNSRLKDLLEAAGGFGRDADTERVNLAAHLEDGAMYRVPRQGEGQDFLSQEGQSPGDSQTGTGPSSKVNINRANRDQLMSLPGIGAGKADAIIAYRRKHGAFARREDIMKIPGLKAAAYARIKDRITVN